MSDDEMTPAVEPSDEEIRTFVAELRSQTNHWFFDDIYTVIVRAALARFASVQKYDPSAVERLIEVGTNALDLIRWINTQATDLAGIVTIDVENDLLAALAALRGEEDGR